jgi:hypothetical protein
VTFTSSTSGGFVLEDPPLWLKGRNIFSASSFDKEKVGRNWGYGPNKIVVIKNESRNQDE